MDLAHKVWLIVDGWDSFARHTVGSQLVRAPDSIAANIAEAHGRYHVKERRQFAFYARGSLHETETWIKKAGLRRLIDPQEVKELEERTKKLGRMLNGYIRTIRPSAERGGSTRTK